MFSDFRFALRPLAKSRGFTAIALLVLLMTASGCAIAGDYRIADGAHMQRSYRSIAGDVHVGRNATINHAKTVAGAIEIGDGATTRSLNTVAGEVRIGESVKVDGNITTVAGDVQIGQASHVTGKVATIAGAVMLDGCRIEGPVEIIEGSLHIRGATALPGGLVVRYRNSDDDRQPTRIDIGPGADIASIEVEPDANVDLRISREAQVSKVTGITATLY